MQRNEEGPNLKVLSFEKDSDIKKTIFDVTRNGNNYHLKVDSCDKGFVIAYLAQVKKIDYTPELLKPMVRPDEIGYIVVHQEHVHEPYWFFRFVGVTLERWTMYRIRRMKRRYEKSIELFDRAEAMQTSLEIDSNAGHC